MKIIDLTHVFTPEKSNCVAPTVKDGTVTPRGTISPGSSYTVKCRTGFTISGQPTVTCKNNQGKNELSQLPTCVKG